MRLIQGLSRFTLLSEPSNDCRTSDVQMPQAWLAPLALPPELLRPRGPPSVTASAAGPPTRSPMLLSPARGEAASSMRLNSATSSLAPLSRAASSVDVGVAGGARVVVV